MLKDIIVNLVIHLLNALLVYGFIALTIRSPRLKHSTLNKNATYLAFIASLLFVVHPIQTDAVTYVYQRLASLAAFFYLLALVSYARWRLPDREDVQARDNGVQPAGTLKRINMFKLPYWYLVAIVSSNL